MAVEVEKDCTVAIDYIYHYFKTIRNFIGYLEAFIKVSMQN